jgi:hypothetical protein
MPICILSAPKGDLSDKLCSNLKHHFTPLERLTTQVKIKKKTWDLYHLFIISTSTSPLSKTLSIRLACSGA